MYLTSIFLMKMPLYKSYLNFYVRGKLTLPTSIPEKK